MSALAFAYQHGGIHLPALQLWLDPHDRRAAPDRVFVSHAHSDHIAGHQEVILSGPTARLMRARLAGERTEHVLPFGEPRLFTTGGRSWQITLLPAGHILGSAMCLLEAAHQTLLYTGDFKLRRGWSAEPCEPRHAEVLIMETTYGRPAYRFPPTADVIAGVIRFCREALDNGESPVLLGYSLGKSQELLRGLSDAGLPLLLHEQIYRLTHIYEQLGQTFPPYTRWGQQPATGRVLLCPPLANLAGVLREIGPVRTAVLTGWAVDRDCRFRYGTDAAFPLSDHADFPDLIEFVQRVAPQRVFTLHGFAAEFAQALRERGFEAQALSEVEQLQLPLPLSPGPRRQRDRRMPELPGRQKDRAAPMRTAGVPPVLPVQPPSAESTAPGPTSTFGAFAATCGSISRAGVKLDKVYLLAAYLQLLPAAVLGDVVGWFGGLPSGPRPNRRSPLGGALLRDALCAVGRVSAAEFRQTDLKHSDFSETAFELFTQRPGPPPGLGVLEVRDLLRRLGTAPGPRAQFPILVEALARASAGEARFLSRILRGDLRIGLREDMIEAALALAFGVSLAEVQRAHRLVGNLAETARLAQRQQLAEVTLVPFRPVKLMLATAAPGAVAAWDQMLEGRPTAADQAAVSVPEPALVWFEENDEGVRCQLHKQQDRVALYGVDLQEITDSFPEVAAAARSLADDLVLEAMVLARRGEQVLSLADLHQRLGQSERDLFLSREIPVVLVVLDLLWRNGEAEIAQPWQARRAILETLAVGWPAALRLARGSHASSAAELEQAWKTAQARGYAGLTVKQLTGAYTPGRSGLACLNLR
jgi:DNA ligase-1